MDIIWAMFGESQRVWEVFKRVWVKLDEAGWIWASLCVSLGKSGRVWASLWDSGPILASLGETGRVRANLDDPEWIWANPGESERNLKFGRLWMSLVDSE